MSYYSHAFLRFNPNFSLDSSKYDEIYKFLLKLKENWACNELRQSRVMMSHNVKLIPHLILKNSSYNKLFLYFLKLFLLKIKWRFLQKRHFFNQILPPNNLIQPLWSINHFKLVISIGAISAKGNVDIQQNCVEPMGMLEELLVTNVPGNNKTTHRVRCAFTRLVITELGTFGIFSFFQ